MSARRHSAVAPRLILASGSPRRREILAGLGLDFTVRAVDLDESVHPGEAPADYVHRLAIEKARAQASPGEIVLAADTTVVVEGEILGKPRDPTDAVRMLGTLAGREHEVLSGVALHRPDDDAVAAGVEHTRVRIAAMDEAEIAWYATTGEPDDKAGAYAIQGLGSLFVEAISGNYTNVVGLPVPLLYRLFQRLGTDLRDFAAAASSRRT